jgi:hypothetical protein
MSEFIQNKKITVTWNSYESMFKHMANHELYTEWLFNQFDSTALISTIDSVQSISWWCEQDALDTDGDGVPIWLPELEGKSLRIEILINETYVESFLEQINEVSTAMNQAPDSIEVTDYTA